MKKNIIHKFVVFTILFQVLSAHAVIRPPGEYPIDPPVIGDPGPGEEPVEGEDLTALNRAQLPTVKNCRLVDLNYTPQFLCKSFNGCVSGSEKVSSLLEIDLTYPNVPKWYCIIPTTGTDESDIESIVE